MQPLDDSSSRRIELRQLRVEDRLFPRDIPAARLPRDPDFVHGSEHERGGRVLARALPINGDRLRRDDIHVEIRKRERETVHESKLRRQHESALRVLLHDRHLILEFDVERARLKREQLLRARRSGLHKLQRGLGELRLREHRWLKQQRQPLPLHRLPTDLRGRERELLLDTDRLRDALRDRRFLRRQLHRIRCLRGCDAIPRDESGDQQRCSRSSTAAARLRRACFRLPRRTPQFFQCRHRNIPDEERRDDGEERTRAVRPAQRGPCEPRPADDRPLRFSR